MMHGKNGIVNRAIKMNRVCISVLLPLLLLPLLACNTESGSNQQYVRDIFLFNQKDTARVSVYLLVDNRPHPSVNKIGLAHYTEHLAWRSISGNSSVTAGQHTNAFTSSHTIGYWNSGNKDELEAIVGRLVNLFQPIQVEKKFAQEERGIVMREFDLRVSGNPFRQAAVVANAFLYENNVTGQDVLGDKAAISALSYNDAIAFQADTHKQESSVLAIVGDVTEKDVKSALRNSGLKPIAPELEQSRPRNNFTMSTSASREFKIVDEPDNRYVIVRRIVQLDDSLNIHKLGLASSLLSDIYQSKLAGGFGKRLYVDDFIVSEYGVKVFPLDEQHIEISVGARPEKQMPMETVVRNILSLLSAESETINIDTFERVKARSSSKWPDWDDDGDTLEWMSNYGLHQLSNLRIPESRSTLKSISASITHRDLVILEQSIRGEGREAVIYLGEDSIE